MRKQVELSITHNGKDVVAYPYSKKEHVQFENGMNIDEFVGQDIATPTITHDTTAIKVGVGDSDVSGSVVDGTVNMTIKGQTYQNILPEPTLRNEMQGKSMQRLNEGYDNIEVVDGVSKSAILKGQTLVNVHQQTLGEITLSCDMKYRQYNIYVTNNPMLMTNRTYLYILDIKKNTANSRAVWNNNRNTIGETSHISYPIEPGQVGRTVFKVNFKDLEGANSRRYNWFEFVSDLEEYTGEIVFTLNIIEYQDGMENWDIPYFEGMASVKAPVLHSVGKNLYNPDTACVIGINNQDISNIIDVKPNTTYAFYANGHSWTQVALYNKAGQMTRQIGQSSTSIKVIFTTTNNEVKARLGFLYGNNTVIEDVDFTGIQFEIGSTSTPYEPYKSSILSTPSDLILRGIGDVQDTLNCLTGEVTERIGEVVLDGSQNLDIQFNTNSQQPNTAFVQYIDSRFEKGGAISCNLPKANGDLWGVSSYDNQFVFNYLYYNENNKKIQILIPYSMLKTIDISGVKQFLSENPIKILLPIKESIKTVDLKVADQKGDVIPTLKSWNTTTHIYSEIPENSLYPILSHSNPSYPVILKPSTKYSIVANSYSNNHTNSAINFNLGGATATTTVGNRVTTITTPSTLSNELLTMSGRGNKLNNVMVIEGDVVGDEPYFEGMCDSKSPILLNVGKNLFDVDYFVEKVNNPNVCYKNEEGSLVIKGSYHSVKINIPYSTTITYLQTSTNTANNGASIFEAQHPDGTCTHIGVGVNTTLERKTWSIKKPIIAIGFNNWAGGENILKDIMLVKTEDSTAYEPYKSNILSCNGDKINLTEDMFEQGTTGEFSVNIGATYHSFKSDSNNRIRTKEIVKVKPNTTYSVICNNGYTARIAGFDINGLCLSEIKSFSSNTTIITTSNNVHYICVILSKISGSISTLDFLQSGLEIREVDKTIVLRSLPNGVCDTLNVKTGEYVQNIGEVVLDGSEDGWGVSIGNPNTNYPTFTNNSIMQDVVNINSGNYRTLKPLCNKYSSYSQAQLFNVADSPTPVIKGIAYRWDGYGLGVRDDDRFNYDSEGLELFKQSLAQNPITVQYELAKPITKTVDISGYPYAYENGHILLESGSQEQSLTPTIEYSIVANRGGQIRSNQRMVERHQKKLDSLYAMTLVNMIDSQYRQVLMKLKSDLPKSEVIKWDIE